MGERVMFKFEKELIVKKKKITWAMVTDIYKPSIQEAEAQESLY